MLKNTNYLFLMDFDGTIANTFEPSPKKFGVNEAYEFAVKEIFGEEGLITYQAIGGLKNRAPIELVSAILAQKPKLIEEAKKIILQKPNEAKLFLDKDCFKKTITEILVQFKLEKLLKQIGTKFSDEKTWPQPYEGIPEFFKKISDINKEGKINIDIGIISSGHTKFIEKTFSLWKIPCPELLVTDDDIRTRLYPEEKERRIKPSSFLFALMHQKWLKKQGINSQNFDFKFAEDMHEKVFYIGDDFEKDGGLAQEAHILFCWFNSEYTEGEEGNKKICYHSKIGIN